MKVSFTNPEGDQVRIENDDGSVNTYPTTEAGFTPWQELLRKLARGEIVIEPYVAPKPLTPTQRKKLGLPT